MGKLEENFDSHYVDSLYQQYKENPQQLDQQWITFFQGYDFARGASSVTQVGDIPIPSDSFFACANLPPSSVTQSWSDLDRKMWLLIQAYRSRAHLYARTDIFSTESVEVPQELSPDRFFISLQELDSPSQIATLLGFSSSLSCRKIIDHLQKVYLSTMGVELGHIDDDSVCRFVCQQIESPDSLWKNPSSDFAQFIWKHLLHASSFESFLQARYVGKKRFGLEGQDSLIPGLQALLRKASESSCKEVLFCMAHRGRLNVLTNVLQKPLEQIFAEFEEAPLVDGFLDVTWDVKYHLGFSSDVEYSGRPLHLSMAYNPSHLESVNGVLLGSARAKQELRYSGDTKAVLPIIMHGDAAVAGQGSVYEAACLYALRGYSVGGCIHIVLNNLVGFTANPSETKSSRYCTDLAKIMNAPVFHVNAEDPLAVAHALEIAVAVRQEHKVDVFVEIVGYRKFGHNEGDDPRFTQPMVYQKVDAYKGILEAFEKQLLESNLINSDYIETHKSAYREKLQATLDQVRKEKSPVHPQTMQNQWKIYRRATDLDFVKSVITGVSQNVLDQVAHVVVDTPKDFPVYPKLEKILQARNSLWKEHTVDWAMAELFAYASLLHEGTSIRLSGEDSQRGTFAHRHAVYKSIADGSDYIALNQISSGKNGAVFNAYNSPLSEYAVMAFDYGFSLSAPESLVIWEAQFGDFVNGAQIVLDQFLSASETKWLRCSGLVLLLPHGYEGQGPEHSSARLERFLQNSAQLNWFVCHPSTPANFFHVLRRQIHAPFRKPLVVLSPKSLLRNPMVRSSRTELQDQSRFLEFILDPFIKDAKKISHIILCSGKVFYDAHQIRNDNKLSHVALVRIEQLYPFFKKHWDLITAAYPNFKSVAWLQEEPRNMGAATYMQSLFFDWRKQPIPIISRPESASTAVGFLTLSDVQKNALLSDFVEFVSNS